MLGFSPIPPRAGHFLSDGAGLRRITIIWTFCSSREFQLDFLTSLHNQEGNSINMNTQPSSEAATGQQQTKRSPYLAGILSFLFCGAGQIYNKQVAKGICLFVVAVGGFASYMLNYGPMGRILASIVMLISIVDAQGNARKFNNGQPVGKWGWGFIGGKKKK